MKAKIIKTGEIVDVYHEPQHGQTINIYKVTDGMGNKRDYEATHSHTCPHIQTERKIYKKKFNNQLKLDFYETD